MPMPIERAPFAARTPLSACTPLAIAGTGAPA